MKRNVKKRYLTLIEMMIVMFIIATITGVLGYRYAGSLDEAKAFKTKTAMERLSTTLSLRAAESPDFFGNITGEWKDAVASSPLVSNPNDLLRDGWGNYFDVSTENGNIVIRSQKYEEYARNNRSMFTRQESH